MAPKPFLGRGRQLNRSRSDQRKKVLHAVGPLVLRRRRRIRLALAWVVGIAAWLGILFVDGQGWFSAASADRWRYHGRLFEVSAVASGEVVVVVPPDGDGDPVTVGLCGITAATGGQAVGDRTGPMTDPAATNLRQHVLGQMVRLSLPPHGGRDDRGRLVAYIYLADGTMLNEVLIAQGWALTQEGFDHQWSQRFALIQMQAKRQRVGVWADQSLLDGVVGRRQGKTSPDLNLSLGGGQ